MELENNNTNIDRIEKPIVDIKVINFSIFYEGKKEIVVHNIVCRRQGEETYKPVEVKELPFHKKDKEYKFKDETP